MAWESTFLNLGTFKEFKDRYKLWDWYWSQNDAASHTLSTVIMQTTIIMQDNNEILTKNKVVVCKILT